MGNAASTERDPRTLDACREIAAELQAVVADAEADLTPEERRRLLDIALAVERAGARAQSGKEKGPG